MNQITSPAQRSAATETDLADIEAIAVDSRRRQTALLLSAVGLLGVLSIHLLHGLYELTTLLSNPEQSAEAPSAAETDGLVFSQTGPLPAALLLASIVGIAYGLRASRKAQTLHAALLARGKSLDIPLLRSEVVGGLRVATASGDEITLVRTRSVGWRKFVNSWMALLGVLALVTAVASILVAFRAPAPNAPFGPWWGWLSRTLQIASLLIGANALLRMSLRPFAKEVAARGHGAGATLRITFARISRRNCRRRRSNGSPRSWQRASPPTLLPPCCGRPPAASRNTRAASGSAARTRWFRSPGGARIA